MKPVTESRRRPSWFRRLSVPGASDPLPRSRELLPRWRATDSLRGKEARVRFPGGAPPFDRLKFWTIHPLRMRLAGYQATRPPTTFYGATWQTLRYWQLLLDEDDEALITFIGLDSEIPDPDEWFARL